MSDNDKNIVTRALVMVEQKHQQHTYTTGACCLDLEKEKALYMSQQKNKNVVIPQDKWETTWTRTSIHMAFVFCSLVLGIMKACTSRNCKYIKDYFENMKLYVVCETDIKLAVNILLSALSQYVTNELSNYLGAPCSATPSKGNNIEMSEHEEDKYPFKETFFINSQLLETRPLYLHGYMDDIINELQNHKPFCSATSQTGAKSQTPFSSEFVGFSDFVATCSAPSYFANISTFQAASSALPEKHYLHLLVMCPTDTSTMIPKSVRHEDTVHVHVQYSYTMLTAVSEPPYKPEQRMHAPMTLPPCFTGVIITIVAESTFGNSLHFKPLTKVMKYNNPDNCICGTNNEYESYIIHTHYDIDTNVSDGSNVESSVESDSELSSGENNNVAYFELKGTNKQSRSKYMNETRDDCLGCKVVARVTQMHSSHRKRTLESETHIHDISSNIKLMRLTPNVLQNPNNENVIGL
jgi:hypothetical protein